MDGEKREAGFQKPLFFDGATFLNHARETGTNDMTWKGKDQEKARAKGYRDVLIFNQEGA